MSQQPQFVLDQNTPPVEMTALPSFEDLMASLGLDNGPNSPISGRPRSATFTPQQPSTLHIPRHGYHSKSISSLREIDTTRSDQHLQVPSESVRNRSRYTPYGISDDVRRTPLSTRAKHSTGSNSSGSGNERNGSLSPTGGNLKRRLLPRLEKVPDDLAAMMPDLPADAPISMYARRNTPQASPISPSFARGHHAFHDYDKNVSPRRSHSPPPPSAGPIALPTLPNLFRHPSSHSNSASPRGSPQPDPGALLELPDSYARYRASHPRLPSSPYLSPHERSRDVTPVA